MDRPCGRHCDNPRCDTTRCFGRTPDKPTLHRAAVLAFPGSDGEPLCRLVLERSTGGGPTAAWLMCNPSRASHIEDDPTASRVVHHSARLGFPRSLVGNIWPLRTPYPSELWPAIADGRITDEMTAANLDALCMIGAQADFHMVAFGAAPLRDYPLSTRRALEAFSCGGRFPLFCLGVASGGEPLHPLARGKFAVRNDARILPWHGWRAPGPNELSWDDVMSDKVRVAAGWADRK